MISKKDNPIDSATLNNGYIMAAAEEALKEQRTKGPEAIDACRASINSLDRAKIRQLRTLANLLIQEGDLTASIQISLQSIALAESTNNTREAGISRANLAFVYIGNDRAEEGGELLKRATEDMNKGERFDRD